MAQRGHSPRHEDGPDSRMRIQNLVDSEMQDQEGLDSESDAQSEDMVSIAGSQTGYPSVEVNGEDIVLVKFEFDVPFDSSPIFRDNGRGVPLVNIYGQTTRGNQRNFEEDMELSDERALIAYLQNRFPGIQRVVIEFNCHDDWVQSPVYKDIAASLKYICHLFADYQIGLDCERVYVDEVNSLGDQTLSAYDAILGMMVLRALDAGYYAVDSESRDWFRGDRFRVVYFRQEEGPV